MIKKEWSSLLKNQILFIVIIAIIAIPFIYAGLFLKSMWDPYGSLDKLPVAVVNEDQPVKYEGKTLNIGTDLVQALKDNDSLDFHFMDKAKADEGLANGTWYMVITIPEHFSENAATLMDETPQKMELQYETNPGTNYIASKMSETALTKIRDEIASQVTETYTEILFDRIADAGSGLCKAADGSLELSEGISDAAEGSRTITGNLEKLAGSTLTFSDGAETLTKGLKEYTDGVSKINSGAKQLDSGTAKLTAKLPELTKGLQTLDNGVKQYTGGIAALNSVSPRISSGILNLETGAGSLSSGLNSLQSGSDKYISAVNTFAENTVLYTQGTEKLAAGAAKLSPLEDLGQISSGIASLHTSVSDGDASLEHSAEQLESGLGSLYAQLQNLEGSSTDRQIQSLSETLASAEKEIKTTGAVMTQAADITTQTVDEITEATVDVRSVQDSISDTASRLPKAKAVLSDAADDISQVTEECAEEADKQISSADEQIHHSREVMTNSASSLEEIYRQLSENDSVSEETLRSMQDVINTLNSSAENTQDISGINSDAYTSRARDIAENTSEDLDALSKSLNNTSQQLNQAADSLADKAEDLSDKTEHMNRISRQLETSCKQTDYTAASIPALPENSISTLTETAGQLYSAAQQLSAGTAEVSASLDILEKSSEHFPEAAAGIQSLNTGFESLISRNQALSAGADSLKAAGTDMFSGITSITAGGKELADGLSTLKEGINSYTDAVSLLDKNSSSLTDGTSQLSDGADTLKAGAAQLSEGTASLSDGTSALASNSSALNTGASQLTQGAAKIHNGASLLAEGSENLDLGMEQLRSGANRLASSLEKGSKEIGEVKATDNTIRMFASPVTADETMMTKVENNGHAMAPYMMSVGLWVGCLAFCLMYPLTKYNGKLKSGFAWWASKASVLYPVALLQGILLILLLHIIDGFSPAEMTKTILFSCLTAAAFTSIMYYFNITLGKVGSFLMLIFMVVQLSGSAGTYPVEISPAFVAKIHAFLPFTYTVNAFRSTISGGESIGTSVLLLIILTILFTGLTILQFCRMARRRQRGQKLLIDWLEEKGLA